jgi:hypothetical protein
MILIITFSVLALSVGVFAVWYIFFRLRKKQVFLVAVPFKDISSTPYSKSTGESLAKRFGGTVATTQDLIDSAKQGRSLEMAGYVSDNTTLVPACGNKPQGLYTKTVDGKIGMYTACSRGYWIKGVKPFKIDAAVKDSNFTVQEWAPKKWNQYEFELFEKL